MVVLTVLVLSAAGPTLAMPGLSAVNITRSEAGLHSEVLAQELLRRGLRVTTSRDIETLLGAERQKQLLGCDAQSCMTELANALGADAIVQGDIGKVDAQWSVTVRIIGTPSGRTLAAFSGQAKENIAALLDHAAFVLTEQLSTALRLDLAPVPEASNRVSRWWAVAPAAIAVGGGVVGAVFTMQAQASLTTLKAATFREDAQLAATQGAGQQTIAWAGFGVAAAGVVGTAAVLIFGGERVAPVVAVDSHGASLGLVGVIP
jgi:hypothetical protein